MGELRGANVFLTGASKGIGAFIARALAFRGANLAITDLDADALERKAANLAGTGTTVVALPADLRDPESIDELVPQVEAALGPVDILVNNAAVARLAPFSEFEDAELRAMVEVNLVAPMILTRRLLPGMIERGRGHVVTVSSLEGRKGIPFDAAYSGTKAALVSWMEGIHVELEGTGVRTSIILPGYVSEAGIFMDRGAVAPRLMGASPAADVAGAVVRAIEQERQEVIVTPRPVRPLLALSALSPVLGDRILQILGVVRVQRWILEHQRASGARR
jgi:short-subunit dehydrogenase